MPSYVQFVGVGIRPSVANAQAITEQRVRVRFTEAMRADAELLDATNYTITPDGGSAARTVVSVSIDADDSVILHLDGVLTFGQANYNVAVALTVADVAGNTLTNPDDADFDGINSVEMHCALALARLAQQFRGRPHIEDLVCTFASRWDGPEQALQDVRTYRALDQAFGIQLDLLGAWLGLLRSGQTDAVYRIRLQAQVQVNASHGRPNELIDILTVLDAGFSPGAIYLREAATAVVILHCLVPGGSDYLGELFVRFLRQAKAVGVRLILEYEESGPQLFTWRHSDGHLDPPPANSGWGAGIWARAVS